MQNVVIPSHEPDQPPLSVQPSPVGEQWWLHHGLSRKCKHASADGHDRCLNYISFPPLPSLELPVLYHLVETPVKHPARRPRRCHDRLKPPMANSGIQIPESFSWLLSAHGLVAGVVIYSSYYVFSVGSIPFIISVVAAGLHLLLAIYFCFAGSRRGTYHLCIIPPCVLIGAGLWAAVLYYFASVLALLLDSPIRSVWRDGNPSYPLLQTWIKVGTATAALNVALDFSMLAVFLIAAMRRSSKPVISAPVMYAPQQQQQQQQVVYPPYPPPPQQQQQQQQYQYQYHTQSHPHHSQQAHYSGIYTSASPPPPPADYKSV
ncbi:hypothetical protein B0T18DRAFT_61773 [Schizothecium vesticola]|uniref:Uncharacterized protein n=1 Tax=Schizothecium vesticola TaxID=314040 RepID=A0AA40F4X9_9PEZI|nr:hypothetical protein B0T18DRAFT_61773 [Schizothecium vesticola]